MDEERYQHVNKACCLDVDLQQFGVVGDLWLVADRGIHSSGGQKAPISLTRAVDPKVARKIFDQCIGKHAY